jgi:hypothetical protein
MKLRNSQGRLRTTQRNETADSSFVWNCVQVEKSMGSLYNIGGGQGGVEMNEAAKRTMAALAIQRSWRSKKAGVSKFASVVAAAVASETMPEGLSKMQQTAWKKQQEMKEAEAKAAEAAAAAKAAAAAAPPEFAVAAADFDAADPVRSPLVCFSLLIDNDRLPILARDKHSTY